MMELYDRPSRIGNTSTTTSTTAQPRILSNSSGGPSFAPLTGPSPAEGTQQKSENPRPIRLHSDVHFHHTNYAQQGLTPLDLLPAMNAIGVLRTTLVPIPTNQMGSCHGVEYHPAKGEASNAANYYLPDCLRQKATSTAIEYHHAVTTTHPLYYNTSVDDRTADMYQSLPLDDRDRFDPMVTGLVLGDQRCSEDLLMKLHRHPGVFTGVGEITIHKEFVEDKLDRRVQANLKNNIAPTRDLFKTCGEVGMPVVMHCDVDVVPHKRGQKSAHLEGVKNLLKDPACQKTTIIWAHMGGLGKYAQARPEHLENVLSILHDPAFKHVHFDLSWDVVAKQLLRVNSAHGNDAIDEAKLNKLAAILVAFPDRFLFGSDALAPRSESEWAMTINTYEPLLEKLPTEVYNKILIENYERIVVGAREKVRAYETYCLPYASIAIRMRQDTLESPPDFRSGVLAQVQMGIAHGRALIDYKSGITTHPPVQPAELMSAPDLERHALQVRPGEGIRLRQKAAL